jgi:hypothetical protein
MTYTMPVMPDGTDREKAVLDTVNCGGVEGIRTIKLSLRPHRIKPCRKILKSKFDPPPAPPQKC